MSKDKQSKEAKKEAKHPKKEKVTSTNEKEVKKEKPPHVLATVGNAAKQAKALILKTKLRPGINEFISNKQSAIINQLDDIIEICTGAIGKF